MQVITWYLSHGRPPKTPNQLFLNHFCVSIHSHATQHGWTFALQTQQDSCSTSSDAACTPHHHHHHHQMSVGVSPLLYHQRHQHHQCSKGEPVTHHQKSSTVDDHHRSECGAASRRLAWPSCCLCHYRGASHAIALSGYNHRSTPSKLVCVAEVPVTPSKLVTVILRNCGVER